MDDKLISFLLDWSKNNDYQIVLPNDGDKDIDFININLKTKTLYFGELGINDNLIDD